MLKLKEISRRQKLLLVTLTLSLMLFIGMIAYVNDYYHASPTALLALKNSETVTITTIAEDVLTFVPKEPVAGLIFYPGGKVEYTSYAPLMHSLAEKGFLCLLPEMTFNLAVLEVNAADGLTDYFPEIDTWYLGGHSLGGSMAASYLAKNTSDYDGLLLCASYSTTDLSNHQLDVISIYGSEDNVLNAKKYAEYKENLPSDYTEYIIDGGCHAYFGNYGAQDGDGTPTITWEQQLTETIEIIVDAFLFAEPFND